ncbi:MAG: RNA polymerase subunit sigma-70, partial [Oscillospiraceae bacterium]|nr:RNA polymerase subunit sigma-70 [Oscillospiraceae bacterium]
RLTAAKRGGGAVDAALEELAECVPSGEDTGAAVEARELARAVNRFLAALPEMQRRVFLCRYWYYDSVADIARRFHWSESRVKMCCKRTREKLAAYLQKEEWL